jgi:hypothetical protein
MTSAKPKLSGKFLALSGTFLHLEEGDGPDVRKAALKDIIASHGDIVDAKVWGRTNILVIGDLPGKIKVRDAEKQAVQIIHVFTLERYLGRATIFQELIKSSPPEITKYLVSYPQKLPPIAQATSPPRGTTAQEDKTTVTQQNHPQVNLTGSNTNVTANTESGGSVWLISHPRQHSSQTIPATAEGQKRSVVFNNPTFKRRKDPTNPPVDTRTTSQALKFVEGTVVTPST